LRQRLHRASSQRHARHDCRRIDIGESTAARINYLPYDGRHFPVRDGSFDAVLLCYVLHHAQDARLVLNEVSRVLREGGLAIIYEDIPTLWWDRMVCWTHDRQWRSRSGHASFSWNTAGAGYSTWLVRDRERARLVALEKSRASVSRRFFVLRATDPDGRSLTQTGSRGAPATF
jgi:SAM-dependent methyltransferase